MGINVYNYVRRFETMKVSADAQTTRTFKPNASGVDQPRNEYSELVLFCV
jgi:hypothetical protein